MMKLYFSPGACSLAQHIVLAELNGPFEIIRVDMKTKTLPSGEDYNKVNPKSQVPALQVHDGVFLTENAVILQYLADHFPEKNLLPKYGTKERYHANEWLNFVATELHKGLGVLFYTDRMITHKDGNEEFKKNWKEKMGSKFDYLSQHLKNNSFILGPKFSAVDAYAFTILNWHGFLKVDLTQWPTLMSYMERMKSLPSVQKAMKAEGLL